MAWVCDRLPLAVGDRTSIKVRPGAERSAARKVEFAQGGLAAARSRADSL